MFYTLISFTIGILILLALFGILSSMIEINEMIKKHKLYTDIAFGIIGILIMSIISIFVTILIGNFFLQLI